MSNFEVNNISEEEELFKTIYLLNTVQPPLDYSPVDKTYNLKPNKTECWVEVSPVKGTTSEGATIIVQLKRTDEGVSISLYAKDNKDDDSFRETWMTFAEAKTDVDDL